MLKSMLSSIKGLFQRIHNVVFYRILLMFVIAIVFSVSVLGVLSIYHSTQTIMQQVRQSSIKSLTEKKNIIERDIMAVDNLCYQILTHSNIRKLQYATTLTHKEHLLMLDVILYLKEICNSNDLISSIYLINTLNDYVLSDTKYRFHDFNDPAALELALSDKPSRAVHRQINGRDTISYIYKPDSRLIYNTCIMININYDNLFVSDSENPSALFDTLVFNDDGNQIFLDSNTLTSVSQATMQNILESEEPSGLFFIDGTEYFICKIRSSVLYWNIAFLQPYSSVVETTALTRKLITSSIIMVLILSLLFAYVFAINIYSPIGRLATRVNEQVVSETHTSSNAYKCIDNAIVALFNKNAELSSKYSAFFPFFKQYSINELLSGNLFDINKFMNVLNMLGVRFIYSRYVNVIIDFENTDFSDNIRGLMDDSLSDNMKLISHIIFKIINNRASIIVNTDMPDLEICRLMDAMKQELDNNGITSTFAIGNSYNDIHQVYSHHREALSLMDTKFFTGKNKIILDKDRKRAAQQFIYDKKLEETLISCINNLDKENAVQTLSLLINKIAGHGGSIEYIRYVYFEVLRNSTGLLDSVGIDSEKSGISTKDIFYSIQSMDTLTSLGDFAEDLIFRFIELIQEYRNMQHEVIIDKAIEFINANFHKDISLNEVAKKVYLSPAYLNNLFKTATGSTIYEYTTKLRMEAAAILLKESQQTIKDIACQIGYKNVQNFLRLFKKYNNMTPVQYRRSP